MTCYDFYINFLFKTLEKTPPPLDLVNLTKSCGGGIASIAPSPTLKRRRQCLHCLNGDGGGSHFLHLASFVWFAMEEAITSSMWSIKKATTSSILTGQRRLSPPPQTKHMRCLLRPLSCLGRR